MPDEPDAAFEDLVVEGLGVVPGLVVVHCDAVSEEHGRNPVLRKDVLVGDFEEDFGEVLAAVIAVTEFEIGLENAVAPIQKLAFTASERASVDREQIVLPSGVERGERTPNLVDVDHQPYHLRPYCLSCHRISESSVFECRPECRRTRQSFFLRVESYENYVFEICLTDDFRNPEHLRETDCRNDPRSVVVRSRIHLA